MAGNCHEWRFVSARRITNYEMGYLRDNPEEHRLRWTYIWASLACDTVEQYRAYYNRTQREDGHAESD